MTTKPIKAGEQIVREALCLYQPLTDLKTWPLNLSQWNTYGDPPNSDLLRRYGHVDLVPLPDGSLGNPADIVEIKASLAVQVITSTSKYSNARNIDERIDWWLEQGGDELRVVIPLLPIPRLYTSSCVLTSNTSVFVIEASDPSLPTDLGSLLRLLLMPQPEWIKTKTKEKPPKPKLDVEVIPVATEMLEKRLGMYETTIEVSESFLFDVSMSGSWIDVYFVRQTDNQLLNDTSSLSRNVRNAIVVRVGEKRILKSTLDNLKSLLSKMSEEKAGPGKKRKGDGESESRKRSEMIHI